MVKNQESAHFMKALVTGAGGFLGGAIAKALADAGWIVTTLQRGNYPQLNGIAQINMTGSIADLPTVLAASEEQDVIFHVAAKAGVWGNYQSYHQTNVAGTENIIAAAKRLRIPKLIYTSSPSVVFDGRDEQNIDESTPYPEYFLNHYSHTKSIAESLVLRAHDKHLATCALRPHLVWGPGDQHLLPRIVERCKQGRLRFVGDGENFIDSTYIDNAVAAHLQAEKSLKIGSSCDGKAYFISNGEPLKSKQLINALLKCAGQSAVDKHISSGVAYTVGACFELGYKLFGIKNEPIMTRFVARQLATEHYFNLENARRDLSYNPTISNEEGFSRLTEHLSNVK